MVYALLSSDGIMSSLMSYLHFAVWYKVRWSIVTSLVAVYVNSIIEELSNSGYDCHMRNVFIVCVICMQMICR